MCNVDVFDQDAISQVLPGVTVTAFECRFSVLLLMIKLYSKYRREIGII